MLSMSVTACLNEDIDAMPDLTIHSTAQVSGSIASTNDIISPARLSALPSLISAVKVNGMPLPIYRLKQARLVLSGFSMTDALHPFITAMCMMSLSVISKKIVPNKYIRLTLKHGKSGHPRNGYGRFPPLLSAHAIFQIASSRPHTISSAFSMSRMMSLMWYGAPRRPWPSCPIHRLAS